MVASRCGGKVVLPMDFGFPPSAMTMLAVIAFLGSLALPPPPRTRWESSQKLEANKASSLRFPSVSQSRLSSSSSSSSSVHKSSEGLKWLGLVHNQVEARIFGSKDWSLWSFGSHWSFV
ncbi:hypothetical protein V6N13_033078 [Hibiscus sabdariffa]